MSIPTKPRQTLGAEVCFCAICEKMIYQLHTKADNYIYDSMGQLKYIELAHAHCAVGHPEFTSDVRPF